MELLDQFLHLATFHIIQSYFFHVHILLIFVYSKLCFFLYFLLLFGLGSFPYKHSFQINFYFPILLPLIDYS